ncbi:hypothetical protein J6590_010000 [Homalodisca vitripennis]|nr:hypothetical protein J6590_010000 [Homalodisca vitripennis]
MRESGTIGHDESATNIVLFRRMGTVFRILVDSENIDLTLRLVFRIYFRHDGQGGGKRFLFEPFEKTLTCAEATLNATSTRCRQCKGSYLRIASVHIGKYPNQLYSVNVFTTATEYLLVPKAEYALQKTNKNNSGKTKEAVVSKVDLRPQDWAGREHGEFNLYSVRFFSQTMAMSNLT